jgi:hypothetical protein
MSGKVTDASPVRDPAADLERTLIAEFLQARGHDEQSLAALTAAQRTALLADASKYAGMKLAEVEARAHYLDELHRA